MTNEIAEELGISFDLPEESAKMVIRLLYKFAAIDGVVPNEEKNLLVKLLGEDESAYDHIAQDANSFNLEDAIAQISNMKETEKSLVGFYLQQIISADETINDEESTLIKRVFESTGIDALCVPEKTGFWKRIFG